MGADEYHGFAERYDRFHGRFDQHDRKEASFFERLFSEHAVESVLDCACGTGHHLHLFHTLGYQVAGSDISDAMLIQARKNLVNAGIPLHKVDYRQLPQHFEQRFDAVVCLSSSLLHMPTEAEARRALHSMHGVLRDGGLLILSQGTTDRQWQEKPRFILAVDELDLTRLFVIDYEGLGARYHILDVVRGTGGEAPRLEVWSVEYPRIYLRDDYERLLQAAGFEAVTFYGSNGFAAYDRETSRRLIVVARR